MENMQFVAGKIMNGTWWLTKPWRRVLGWYGIAQIEVSLTVKSTKMHTHGHHGVTSWNMTCCHSSCQHLCAWSHSNWHCCWLVKGQQKLQQSVSNVAGSHPVIFDSAPPQSNLLWPCSRDVNHPLISRDFEVLFPTVGVYDPQPPTDTICTLLYM